MFGNHPVDDWRALTENYRARTDEELLELAADFNDLTQTAQQILRDELKLRKLPDPQAPNAGRAFAERANSSPPSNSPHSAAEDDSIESGLPVEYTWKTPLCDCEGDVQAWQISEVLRRAGIESWIEGDRTYAYSSGSRHASVDEGNRRVVVAADQLDEARAIIAMPIPQDIIEESQKEPDDVYQPPVCPKCGAADPVLESADPVNAWKCDVCGAEWTDSAADPADPALNDSV